MSQPFPHTFATKAVTGAADTPTEIMAENNSIRYVRVENIGAAGVYLGYSNDVGITADGWYLSAADTGEPLPAGIIEMKVPFIDSQAVYAVSLSESLSLRVLYAQE